MSFPFCRSNAGHPFAVGLTLAKLAAVTVDEDGKETFVTGGALDRVQKASTFCILRDISVARKPLRCGTVEMHVVPSRFAVDVVGIAPSILALMDLFHVCKFRIFIHTQ